MASYKLLYLAALAPILLATAPAHAQTTIDQSTCSTGWTDANQNRTGTVCTRTISPTTPAQAAPPARESSGSSAPPRETTENGVRVLRGGR
jgi:hypothetical protein